MPAKEIGLATASDLGSRADRGANRNWDLMQDW